MSQARSGSPAGDASPAGDDRTVGDASHGARQPAKAAYLLAACGAGAAAAVVVLAAVAPSPDRHLRGLLLIVGLGIALGVLSAWIRVVRALRASGSA